MHANSLLRPVAAVAVVAAATFACGADDGAPPAAPAADATPEVDAAAPSILDASADGETGFPVDPTLSRMVIYQLPVRLFGNTRTNLVPNGTKEQNGVGKFDDVNDAALSSLYGMGVTWIYLTGVLRQATLTDWSSIGLPADDPDVVKGRAGSFFAIRDLYDVSPDYGTDPVRRREEFDALVARIHRHHMKVMIDLIPNHVARGYHTVVPGKSSFGEGDDQSQRFALENSFYYVQDTGGLTLPGGDWSTPPDVVRDHAFAPENGTPGHRPRGTGDNLIVLQPPSSSWYETVKLNYGAKEFPTDWWVAPTTVPIDPASPPKTWRQMDDVIAYWLRDRDVDGFRCDLLSMVPTTALKHLMDQARTVKPNAFFLAEVYAEHRLYLDAGFDAVYHKDPRDRLKSIGRSPTIEATLPLQSQMDSELALFTSAQRGRLMHFLENHDEARVMAKPNADDSQSGWSGGARAHLQMAPIVTLLTKGPVLFFAGQEVGERAEGAEGFGGDDGKTTMFDYWSIRALAGWTGPNHTYDGGGLTPEQAKLRRFYGKLMQLSHEKAFLGDVYVSLDASNEARKTADYPTELYSYLRCERGSGGVALVISSFYPSDAVLTNGLVRIDAASADACGLQERQLLSVSIALDVTSGDSASAPTPAQAKITREDLVQKGLAVAVSGQSTTVLRLR